jgi:hypothetical protein
MMATHELIDAQFDRAVEIVQGLPKTGPIQTDYEEKLQMYRYAPTLPSAFIRKLMALYSLYKQGSYFHHLYS